MGFGDFGGWKNWTPRDHALNKLAYDEAHKNGGSNRHSNNTGCAVWFFILIAGLIVVLSRAA